MSVLVSAPDLFEAFSEKISRGPTHHYISYAGQKAAMGEEQTGMAGEAPSESSLI